MLQGILTCGYISLLSSFGERMAARLRCRLFSAVIVQDVAFFDANKTGEILNRLVTFLLLTHHCDGCSVSSESNIFVIYSYVQSGDIYVKCVVPFVACKYFTLLISGSSVLCSIFIFNIKT